MVHYLLLGRLHAYFHGHKRCSSRLGWLDISLQDAWNILPSLLDDLLAGECDCDVQVPAQRAGSVGGSESDAIEDDLGLEV